MRFPFNGDFPLTQKFGENPDVYKQFGMSGHNGLDYGLPTGTEVLAPINGKVVETSIGMAGYGHYVKIESDTEGSLLAHLQDLSVSIGDGVTEGQLIGHSDNTGFSTGPHLHWGYYKMPRDRNNGYAGYIDQLPLLDQPLPHPTPPSPTVPTDDELRALQVLKDEHPKHPEFTQLEALARDLVEKYNHPPQSVNLTPTQTRILAFFKGLGIG